jgi:hypothetical protein
MSMDLLWGMCVDRPPLMPVAVSSVEQEKKDVAKLYNERRRGCNANIVSL